MTLSHEIKRARKHCATFFSLMKEKYEHSRCGRMVSAPTSFQEAPIEFVGRGVPQGHLFRCAPRAPSPRRQHKGRFGRCGGLRAGRPTTEQGVRCKKDIPCLGKGCLFVKRKNPMENFGKPYAFSTTSFSSRSKIFAVSPRLRLPSSICSATASSTVDWILRRKGLAP